MLTREEFILHIAYVRGDLSAVVAHLDLLNGRTRELETDLAVLNDRSPARAAAIWGGGGATMSLLFIEAAKWFLR